MVRTTIEMDAVGRTTKDLDGGMLEVDGEGLPLKISSEGVALDDGLAEVDWLVVMDGEVDVERG